MPPATPAIAQAGRPARHWPGLMLGLAAVALTEAALATQHSMMLSAVLGAGLLLGVAFVWFEYGFTGGFRALLTSGDGRAMAASLIIPAVAALVVIPVAMGSTTHGRYVAPLGLSLLVGAAVFGIGMQLSNGCGSGTLVAAGEGSRRMWVTLLFFCLGGVPGAMAMPVTERWPTLGVVDLPDLLGPWGGLAATEALIGASMVVLLRGRTLSRPLIVAGVVIGLLAALMFLASGDPWGVTAAMAVWGAKALRAAGLDPGGSEFWGSGWGAELLAMPLLQLPSTVSNIGVMLGALLAAAWLGRLRHGVPIGARGVAGAALGGLLMGFGARLSYGCNVGAFVGGVSSGSLHGFVWAIAALPGCWVGIRMRPWFGLPR